MRKGCGATKIPVAADTLSIVAVEEVTVFNNNVRHLPSSDELRILGQKQTAQLVRLQNVRTTSISSGFVIVLDH